MEKKKYKTYLYILLVLAEVIKFNSIKFNSIKWVVDCAMGPGLSLVFIHFYFFLFYGF